MIINILFIKKGLIRKHEASDGEPLFYHALCMSLTYSGLGFNPTYIYPATSADTGAENSNKGYVPEGALLMLPPDFNTSKISSLNLRKVVNHILQMIFKMYLLNVYLQVAETLKVYGAYVVDRNDGTPYAIYVENGASFRLSNKTTWDNTVADELQRIRAGLKMVKSADHYLDGNGDKLIQPYPNQNMFSMRGSTAAWNRVSGDATALYDTWSQSLVYAKSNNQTTTYQNWSGLGINRYTPKLQFVSETKS